MVKRSLQKTLFFERDEEWVYSVNPDEFLLQLKRLLDKMNIEKELVLYYSDVGRPSRVDVLFRMSLLQYFYNLSDRQVVWHCTYNRLFRVFIGLKDNELPPDDTTLVKFRARLSEGPLQDMFNRVVEYAREKKLISDIRAVDATHMWANCAIPTTREILRQARYSLLKKVKRVSKKRYNKLAKKYLKTGKNLEEEMALTRELLKALSKETDSVVRESAMRVERLLRGEVSQDIVSFVDEDARWGKKSKRKSFMGYKVHASVDPKSDIITSVEVYSGNVNEKNALPEIIRDEKERGLPVKKVIADGLYDSVKIRKSLRKMGVIPYIPVKKGVQFEKFKYDDGALVCPCGERTISKIKQGTGELYYFSVKQCKNCALKRKCVSRGELRKKVFLSESRKESLKIGDTKPLYKLRLSIERIFGIGKQWHRLSKAILQRC